ncbi:MAG: hypothetical protein GX241_07510 [Ruminococcaceae bacterium]|nr:hypothetical protein [Oscillospiraceae bacterium]
MPSSSRRILRGLDIQGRRTYYPRLKMENSPEPAGQEDASLSVSAVDEAEQAKQVEEILTGAREEGEKLRQEILAEAVAEARLLGEKAREEGFQEGFRQGEKAAEKLLEEARHTLEQACRERREILAEAEPEIIRVALGIAEKLLGYKVSTDSRCILAMIARGLNVLPAGQKVNIKINPLDEKVCRENFYGLRELLKEGVLLEVMADEKIPPGSCRLESEEAEVEMLLQKELQILGKKLLELAVSSGKQYLQETAEAMMEEV